MSDMSKIYLTGIVLGGIVHCFWPHVLWSSPTELWLECLAGAAVCLVIDVGRIANTLTRSHYYEEVEEVTAEVHGESHVE